MNSYRIDYDNLDVVDLVNQIRDRVAQPASPSHLEPGEEERLRVRLRSYLDLNDVRPFELQDSLGLRGTWNVAPEDLRRSSAGLRGRLIHGMRLLARPFVKLAANVDLPLYKQFKVNMGVASALHDLLQEQTALQGRLQQIEARLDALDRTIEQGTVRGADKA